MVTATRYQHQHPGIMAPHLSQPQAKEQDQAEVYDEGIYHVQPTFPLNNFPLPNNNSPAYSMFHPAAWQSDMNSMVFMDALQSWGPHTNGSINNPQRPVTMGMSWQQPSPPMTWDMFGRDLPVEPQYIHTAPVQYPYPVRFDPPDERTVTKTEKHPEGSWESGWGEELYPSLDTTMHPVGTIQQAMSIDGPVEGPSPAHAPRKRRRVPSPMVQMPVYTTTMGEAPMQSTEAPVPTAAQLPEQQQTCPPTSSTFLKYDQAHAHSPTSPIQAFPPHSRARLREPTPTLEEIPEYVMANTQPHPTPSAPMIQSPSISAQFIGPVPAPRTPVSKVRRGTQAVFKTQSANSKRGHYASDVWERHKAAIKNLYIDEGKPLREVIKIMEVDHDFPATQRMYKARFKQWGFVKNNTEKVVSQILRTKFERDAAGKLSHFTRNGKDVNLQNYLQRKGLTEYDLVDFASGADSNSEHSGDSNSDSGSAKTLLAQVRCRTPPIDVPGNLRLPDRLRFQDTLVMSFKRAFLLWRQEEQEKDFGLFQPSVFTWRVTDFPHLSNLIESARLIRSGDNTSGIAALNQAFWSMNGYLTSMDATASFYFFFHRQSRPWQEDARIALAVWKFLAAYASARNHNNHPLFHTFKLMYEVIQKEGVTGLRTLLTESSNTVADELERAFGREHWLKDLIWHRCFPEKSKLRHLQLIRDLRDQGPTRKIVKRLY